MSRLIEDLEAPFCISVVTQVELEGGINRNPLTAMLRRRKLDELLEWITVLPFEKREADAYGRIVTAKTYVRSRILDRMIAATAIVRGARVITIDGDGFSDIDGLSVELWSLQD